MIGLDYSSARLPGSAIREAGYDFVVRYVGTPGRAKNIIGAEYQDLMAAGVAVALVYENVAEDALGGFAAGQASARAARADADSIGFPAGRPIYFAVDWVATSPQMPAVMDYLDGAANVLGVDRVGVYGFELTIRKAEDAGHARWFWQCGARSALAPGVHLYQHNNDNTVVAGITCDVNDALAIDFGQCPNPLEDDMTPEQDVLLRDVHEQLCGNGSRTPGTYPGWDTWDGTGRNLTTVDLLRDLHGAATKAQPSNVPGSTVTLSPLAAAMAADGYGYRLLDLVGALAGKVDGLSAALAQLAGAPGAVIDLVAVTKAAEAGTRAALGSVARAADAALNQSPAPSAPVTPTGGTP